MIALLAARTGLAAALAVTGVTAVHQGGAGPVLGPAPDLLRAAAPATPGDPVFPGLGNAGYDALGYHLAFDYREDTRTVDAVAEMTARSTADLPWFELDALGLSVHGVRVNGRPAAFSLHDEKLRITPAATVRRGSGLTVGVTYSADPRAPLPHSGWVPTADGFALAGQPNSAHTIFPCNDHPSDKARYTVRVTAPSRLLGVAGGTLTDTAEHGGRTTRSYVMRDPMAAELLQVAVGDYLVEERPLPGGPRLRDVVPVGRATALRPALDLTAAQLAWAERHLGAFPFEAYGLLPVDTDDPAAFGFTGLETQTLTLYKPGFLTHPEPRIGAHMMHAWFGDSVSPRTWADLWLNEGHADYYGMLYRYERGWPDGLGLTSLEAGLRQVYAQGDQWRLDSGPVAAPTRAGLFDSQRYAGGALVLFALREKVGAAVFDRIERAFLARYRHGVAGTGDFIATAGEVAGQDLSGFLTEWLYGTRTPPMPGHPDWTVTAPVPGGRSPRSAPQGSATL
ncbi:M1 family metallopeptidase [Streptomyces sp. CB03911]|uniref:M1 family metallopeptidase n=1 Tax=Streptomyces sp. CB03911 TaxID=1804758 RepID=UPI0009401BD1|nr:M1 family metallopeptidase [Streptomyces sp. CB03911]OKI18607.1 zinc metalloprotease [Streptomyces sp. CB03911]